MTQGGNNHGVDWTAKTALVALGIMSAACVGLCAIAAALVSQLLPG